RVRPRLFLVMGLFLVLFVLVSCSKDDEASGVEKEDLDNINEEGFPIVDEKVTLDFFAAGGSTGGDWNDVMLMEEYEEMTNIHVEWEMVPQDGREEKRNLVLSGSDLPDVF